MPDAFAASVETAARCQHFDVVIVGAGIAGIGSAYHLQTQAPERSFTVLETQAGFGGTWRTHRYPGVRSDSDLYTFGYRFKPWRGVPIASGSEILAYMQEVIEDNDLERRIQFGVTVVSAHWSSAERRWTLEIVRAGAEAREQITAGFLWMCQGYYRHDKGYTPDWPGLDAFQGQVLHPQSWPQDFDYEGKRIVVIGSGATAATLIPALADRAAHVTMLQRSPTYFLSGLNVDDLAETLRTLEIDETWIHEIVRRKKLHDLHAFTRLALDHPELAKAEIIAGVREQLGDDFDVDTHFTPRYDPWRQRIAFVPDGDLFKALKSGQASVVTDEIDRFEPEGVRLKSGDLLAADVVVTATGFDLSVLGDIAFTIDNQPLDWAQTVTYRGMMFTGVPNLVWVFGYFRASWTLRADLIGDFVPRLLKHMEAIGAHSVRPALRSQDEDMPLSPWVDPAEFNPGYLTRSLHLMPKSGSKREWRHTQDYMSEKDEFAALDLNDSVFVYA